MRSIKGNVLIKSFYILPRKLWLSLFKGLAMGRVPMHKGRSESVWKLAPSFCHVGPGIELRS